MEWLLTLPRSQRDTMIPDQSPAVSSKVTPRYIFTLVHGTFASNATWPLPGSLLRQTLEDTFGRECVTTTDTPFRWSGKNSHQARLSGGNDLAAWLRDIVNQSKDAHHFIIAHSHGGMVALYALRHTWLANSIAGLVCLGTPFICCEERNVNFGIKVYTRILVVCLAFLVLASLICTAAGITYATYLLSEDLAIVIGFLLIFVTVIGATAIAGRLGMHVDRRLCDCASRWAKSKQNQILEKFSLAGIVKLPLLCFSVAQDEARLYLAFWRAAAEWPFLLLPILAFVCLGILLLHVINAFVFCGFGHSRHRVARI
jgi:pimeloyl-ACP methyl ester carboxylesterase